VDVVGAGDFFVLNKISTIVKSMIQGLSMKFFFLKMVHEFARILFTTFLLFIIFFSIYHQNVVIQKIFNIPLKKRIKTSYF